ncbi:MAG: XRE family transcriptional regulator [Candidatus Korobacteraceae bacterium]|jgi:Zn-dependent peptidase ImmA (M78 family)
MSIDLKALGSKLRRYREQLQLSIEEVEAGTGIDSKMILAFENGERTPTGDQILIFADFFHCDYRFFVSNEKLASFEQTETLYRRYGEEFRKDDRRRVQEFLFLCECEEFLIEASEKPREPVPQIQKKGGYFKGHAEQAAAELRKHLGYKSTEVPMDVYADFRRLGCHIFRRTLDNSNISGLFIRHPVAANCVLVNYSEDVYRQRFSAAHEVAHAFLDEDEEVVVSFYTGRIANLREVRANAFASNYLIPPEFLRQIPDPTDWPTPKALEWASKLKVSTEALSIALREANLVSEDTQAAIKNVRVDSSSKVDPELPISLSPKSRERKENMLRRGLSDYYVGICLDGYERGAISAARLAEMLLVDERELRDIAALLGRSLEYAG